MIAVTQRLPTNNGSQRVYLNPDNIERVLPYLGGATVQTVSGADTDTVETPEQILALIKGDSK
jgi:hypothetical protein